MARPQVKERAPRLDAPHALCEGCPAPNQLYPHLNGPKLIYGHRNEQTRPFPVCGTDQAIRTRRAGRLAS